MDVVMNDLQKLKASLFVLAGYLADGESMTAPDVSLTVREIVARIHADRNIAPLALAMVTMELAIYADTHSGVRVD